MILKTDGSVVDVEGNVPTFLDRTSTSVRVIYIPRHHMRVATTNYVTGVNPFTGSQTYDFTTGGQSKAYMGTTNTQLVYVTTPTAAAPFNVYALYAGDNNQFSPALPDGTATDGVIDISDFSDVSGQNALGTFGFIPEDLNNDSQVDITDFSYVSRNTAIGPFFNR